MASSRDKDKPSQPQLDEERRRKADLEKQQDQHDPGRERRQQGDNPDDPSLERQQGFNPDPVR